MTKARAALSYEAAQARVSGLIGAKRAADLVGVPLRTFYDWGDPAVDRTIPIAAAETLDRAYLAAGGTGAPFLDTLHLRLKTARAQRHRDQLALVAIAATFAKESGDFTAASFRATLPDATPDDLATLRKEGLEAIAAAQSVVSAADAIEAAARAPPDTG